MPLTEKGGKIKSAMEKQYGPETGERVFYASKNKGKITGVDSNRDDDNQHMGFTAAQAEPVKKLVDSCDALISRIDAFEHRKAQRQPISVKPKKKDNLQPSNPHPKDPGG
jgi:hypothetical protein